MSNKYLEKVAKIVNLSGLAKTFKTEVPKAMHINIHSPESESIYNNVKSRLGPGPRVNDVYHQGIHDQIAKWRESIPNE